MINTMIIDGRKAVISYDPEAESFRGEFVGLTGGADFYATTIRGLHKEGAASLRVYLDECKKMNVEPFKTYSGKFVVRIASDLHAQVAALAAATGKSLNEIVEQAVEHELKANA
jgi:predicted HicB family RNase H-like nuclease